MQTTAVSPDGRIVRGQNTRDSLLVAGRLQFGTRGYEATSIDSILQAAGVARGALYHHFASKEALFDGVLDQVIGELAAAVRAAARREHDPAESLRVGCLTWLDLAIDPAVQRIVLLDAPAVVGWTRYRELDDQHTLGATKLALRRIARSGGLPAESTDVLAHLILAAVGEAALLIARADDQAAARVSARAALEILLTRLIVLRT